MCHLQFNKIFIKVFIYSLPWIGYVLFSEQRVMVLVVLTMILQSKNKKL